MKIATALRVSIALYKSKTLADGSHPLMLQISGNKARKYVAIGLSCTADLWDFKRNAPKRNHPHRKYLESIIDQKKAFYQLQLLALEREQVRPTVQELVKLIKKPEEGGGREVSPVMGVFPFLITLVDSLMACGKVNRAKLYKVLYRSLGIFFGSQSLSFDDIDAAFLNRYEVFLYQKEITDNTINSYFKLLRALINKAIVAKHMSKEANPFLSYSLSKFNTITRKRAMQEKDLQRLIDFPVEEGSNLGIARDYFLFSYYGRGMNFKDMACLKWGQIVNEQISYCRFKTGQEMNFTLRPAAVMMLERYKAITGGKSDDFVFPILDKVVHRTPLQVNNRIDNAIWEVNRSLQELSRQAGIAVHLTTYVARHTYATLLKYNGVPTSVISEALGHQTERITQTYLKSFGADVIDAADKVLI